MNSVKQKRFSGGWILFLRIFYTHVSFRKCAAFAMDDEMNNCYVLIATIMFMFYCLTIFITNKLVVKHFRVIHDRTISVCVCKHFVSTCEDSCDRIDKKNVHKQRAWLRGVSSRFSWTRNEISHADWSAPFVLEERCTSELICSTYRT